MTRSQSPTTATKRRRSALAAGAILLLTAGASPLLLGWEAEPEAGSWSIGGKAGTAIAIPLLLVSAGLQP